jgi:hypothetical protein
LLAVGGSGLRGFCVGLKTGFLGLAQQTRRFTVPAFRAGVLDGSVGFIRWEHCFLDNATPWLWVFSDLDELHGDVHGARVWASSLGLFHLECPPSPCCTEKRHGDAMSFFYEKDAQCLCPVIRPRGSLTPREQEIPTDASLRSLGLGVVFCPNNAETRVRSRSVVLFWSSFYGLCIPLWMKHGDLPHNTYTHTRARTYDAGTTSGLFDGWYEAGIAAE